MKKVCLVLFGGQSSEHEISCLSVQNVISYIDRDTYDLCLVGITREGRWLYVEDPEEIRDGSWVMSDVRAILSPDAADKCVYLLSEAGMARVMIDVALPVLHGLYGEDGTVQGIFSLAKIPYVGCGVLSSAITMDKIYTKIVVDRLHIRQADYVAVYRRELTEMEMVLDRVEAKLPYPVFVKPSCAGSSVGVHRAENRKELESALVDASKHDAGILVEEEIRGREIECAVLGTDQRIRVSGVGEILAAAEFYDYDAKYNNADSQTVTDPDLPGEIVEEIRSDSEKIFRAVGGYSLSRVDFFVDEKGVVFNEINTIPGFTAISMYPMLFEKAGLSKEALLRELIETAYERREH